jgi:hypothetical protein
MGSYYCSWPGRASEIYRDPSVETIPGCVPGFKPRVEMRPQDERDRAYLRGLADVDVFGDAKYSDVSGDHVVVALMKKMDNSTGNSMRELSMHDGGVYRISNRTLVAYMEAFEEMGEIDGLKWRRAGPFSGYKGKAPPAAAAAAVAVRDETPAEQRVYLDEWYGIVSSPGRNWSDVEMGHPAVLRLTSMDQKTAGMIRTWEADYKETSVKIGNPTLVGLLRELEGGMSPVAKARWRRLPPAPVTAPTPTPDPTPEGHITDRWFKRALGSLSGIERDQATQDKLLLVDYREIEGSTVVKTTWRPASTQ